MVCVLSCVEPCWSFEIHRNREKKKLELEPRYRKCLFLYHYWMHPVFGFLNARIQTWFPFPVQICLNGREWLARQMGAARSRRSGCFAAEPSPLQPLVVYPQRQVCPTMERKTT